MGIIVLKFLSVYHIIDASSLIDMWQYMIDLKDIPDDVDDCSDYDYSDIMEIPSS